jgi:hypothetical protein
MNRTLILALISAVVLTGCDSSQPQPQSTPPPAKPHYQRFVPILPETIPTQDVPWNGFVALDTRTGTLCRTVINKEFSKGSWVNDIPACSQILKAETDSHDQ